MYCKDMWIGKSEWLHHTPVLYRHMIRNFYDRLISHFKFVSDYKSKIELFIDGMTFLLLEQKMAFLVGMIG